MTTELLTLRSSAGDRALLPAAVRRRMLDWYRRHHRDLPWRRNADPYRVWISEVMLQQTRVATALPFYQRFLERFPTLESLARAREPDVLAAWSGLGYYHRARHLLAAARDVVREHAGRIPDDPERFGRLPGVGPYTAGAVLSIAFDRPLAVLDGNVARVLSRLYAVDASVRDSRGSRRLWRLARALVPMRRPGIWNQTLMELGARVCLPRAPRCDACPARRNCRARAMGRVEDFPPVTARRAPERVRRAVVLIERDGRFLMTPRRGALLDGLWEPPGADIGNRSRRRSRGNRARLRPRSDPARTALRRALAALGLRVRLDPTGAELRHTITHREITVELWRGTPIADLPRSRALRFVDPRRPRVAITALARRLAVLPAGRVA